MTFKGADLYNIKLSIADSKQYGCDYAQAAIFRKINQSTQCCFRRPEIV